MAKNKNIHTVYNEKEREWENKQEGSTKPISTAPTKQEAQALGREQAIINHSEHLIHNMNGQIGSKNSYGNDPKDTKG